MTNRKVEIVLDDDEDENIESKASNDTVHISLEEDNTYKNDAFKGSPPLNLDNVLSMKPDEGKSSSEISANYSNDFNTWFNNKLNSAPWLKKSSDSESFVLKTAKVPDNATGKSILENCLLPPTSQNFSTGGNLSSLHNQSNASKGSLSLNLTTRSRRSQNSVIIGDKLSQGGERSKGNFMMANETVVNPPFNPLQDSILMKTLLTNNSSLDMLESQSYLNVPTAMGMQQSILSRPIAINVQIPASNNDGVAIVEVPASTGNSSSGFQPLDSVAGHHVVIVPPSNNQSSGNIVLNTSSNTLVQHPHSISSINSNSNISSQIYVMQSMAEPSNPTLNPSLNMLSPTPYTNVIKNSIQMTGGHNDIHCKVVSSTSTSTTNVHILSPNSGSIISRATNIQGLDSNRVANNQSGLLIPSIPFQGTRGTPVGISFNPITRQTELVCITDSDYASLSSKSCQNNNNQSTRKSQSGTFVASKLLKALESGVLKPLCNVDSSKISWKVVDKSNSEKKNSLQVDKNVVVIDDSSDEDQGKHEPLPQSFSSISDSFQDSSSTKTSTNNPSCQSFSDSRFVTNKSKIIPDTISNNAVNKETLSNSLNTNDQSRNSVIINCSKLEPLLSVNESDPTLSKLNYFKEENQCNEESDLASFGHRHKRQKVSLQEETSNQDELNLGVSSNLIPPTLKQEITTLKLDCDVFKDASDNGYDHRVDEEVKLDEIPNVLNEEDCKEESKDDDDNVHIVLSEDVKNSPGCSSVLDGTGTDGSTDIKIHDQEDSSCADVKPFACSYCGFRVAIESNLEMHVKAFHIGKKAKSMPILQKNNNPSKKINALVVKTQMFRCFVCDYCTYRFSNFNLHLMSEHDIYACNKCSFMVDNADELKSHETIHKKGAKSYSKHSVAVEKEESGHLNASLGSPFEVKSESCNFKASSQMQMNLHTSSSHSDWKEVTVTTYECDKCSQKFIKESDLLRHKMTHTDRCRFPCDSCGFRASSQESLVNHKKLNHPLREAIFCCHCDFSTDNHAELKEHKHSSHPTKYPFVCKKCNFRTSRDSILHRHIKLHHGTSTNEPPTPKEHVKSDSGDNLTVSVTNDCLPGSVQSGNYKCSICSYSTYSENGLKVHMETHDSLNETTIGKYKCSFCKFKSNKMAVLNKHRYEVHLNEHPYSCRRCIFRTTIPYRLMKHEQSAHNIKRKHYELHECSICDFKSSELTLLVKHKNHTHSSKFNFKCSHCQYCTNSTSHFLKHCKTVHRNKITRNIKETEKKQNSTNYASGSSDDNNQGKSASVENLESESSALLYYCEVCDYKTKCCVEFEKHKVSKHERYAECGLCPFIADTLDGLYCHSFKVHPSVCKHKCPYCNFSHSSKQTVSSHTQMHNAKACYYCEFKAMASHLLDLHIQKVHPDKQLKKCDLCGYKTTQPSLLTTHVSKLHEILKCTVCSFFTHSQYEIFKHKYTHHQHLLPFSCHECNFRAQESVLLDQHKLEVHNKQCCRCTFLAPTYDKLNVHTYVEHTSDFYLKCLFCNYFAENPEDLYKHESNFHSKVIYRCSRCIFSCESKNSLLSHIISCHPKSGFALTAEGDIINRKICGYCDFSTLSSGALYKHFGSCHPTEYPWKCDKCYYRAKLKIRLTEHENTKHIDRGQFKGCQFCDFRAEKKTDVRTHEFTIHANEFSLSCDLCSYRARRNDSLLRHKIRWHSSDCK